jgi:hypothetical protein
MPSLALRASERRADGRSPRRRRRGRDRPRDEEEEERLRRAKDEVLECAREAWIDGAAEALATNDIDAGAKAAGNSMLDCLTRAGVEPHADAEQDTTYVVTAFYGPRAAAAATVDPSADTSAIPPATVDTTSHSRSRLPFVLALLALATAGLGAVAWLRRRQT